MKKTLLSIVLLVALGAIGWYLLNKQSAVESLVTEDNAVLLIEQQPGDETVVSYAKLSKPGYVVISETDASGTTRTIGTSELLQAGEHKNVRISHPGTITTNGSTVSAVIVADNGDGAYTESDTEILVVESDSGTEAIISESADDGTLSDEEIVDLLTDSGYGVLVDTNELSSDTPETSDEEMIEESATTTEAEVGISTDETDATAP